MQRLKVTAVLAAAAIVVAGTGAGAADRTDRDNRGLTRLTEDVTGGLRLERSGDGVVHFVGTTAGNAVINSSVSPDTGVRAAARSHLSRYGAALGANDAVLAPIGAPVRSASGQDVVRFQQHVDSAPVIGSQVVVSVRGDRQLTSMLATLSTVRELPSATVPQSAAGAVAARSAARSAGSTGLMLAPQGRAVWDPSVFGARGSARGVWQFEVGDGAAVRRLVLVDDTTGHVLLDLDQIEHLDRVVCDRANTRGAATPCTANFARTEDSGPRLEPDVDAAFDHAGSTAAAFSELGGIDLTDLIGIDVGGVKKLASTVRYCQTTGSCPYANAFWNGTQMFYGDTYAVADDVVGHEMTHGVIDQYSELFYWGQSGAINESMADIMGEIVDHRAGLVAGDANWRLGEDLPIGAIRDLKNPPAYGDPDKMSSPSWEDDTPSYGDRGGVHVNSGVGNKTAYLISQGGLFNGQSMTGIDGADTGLTRTGRLYFEAITRLTSGSDYADLAAVLEQSCADFVSSGTSGFTPANCSEVGKAVRATELRTTPTNAPQPLDAVKSCPVGTTMRGLFDSETASPASKFSSTSAGMWGYGVNAAWGSNATSGRDSWFGLNPDPNVGDPASASLTTTSGIALPAGQQSYLSFNQWRVFEWYTGAPPLFIDGGTVEVDAGTGPVDTASLQWTNGPQQTLQAYPGDSNRWAGRTAFAGDSFGWTTSQLDLSTFAGKIVKPSFTTRGDVSVGIVGWFLDDIAVYTCDPAVVPATPSPTSTPTAAPTTPVVTTASSTTRLKARTRTTVTIIARVRSAGATVPGKVTFRVDRKRLVRTIRLRKGRAVLKLTGKQVSRLGPGKHTVRAFYRGSDTVERSSARVSFRLR